MDKVEGEIGDNFWKKEYKTIEGLEAVFERRVRNYQKFSVKKSKILQDTVQEAFLKAFLKRCLFV